MEQKIVIIAIISLISSCFIILIVAVAGLLLTSNRSNSTSRASPGISSVAPDTAAAPGAPAPAAAPAAPAPAAPAPAAPAPVAPAPANLPSNIDFVKGWSGNHENPGGKVPGPEKCRQLALNSNGKYVAWGYRNDTHPDPALKNTCFLYTQGFAPYTGNTTDNIHLTGCLYPEHKVIYGCKTQQETIFLPIQTALATQLDILNRLAKK